MVPNEDMRNFHRSSCAGIGKVKKYLRLIRIGCVLRASLRSADSPRNPQTANLNSQQK